MQLPASYEWLPRVIGIAFGFFFHVTEISLKNNLQGIDQCLTLTVLCNKPCFLQSTLSTDSEYFCSNSILVYSLPTAEEIFYGGHSLHMSHLSIHDTCLG